MPEPVAPKAMQSPISLGRDLHGEDAFAVEAVVDCFQAAKAADENRGAGEKDSGESHLEDHQTVVKFSWSV